MKLSVVLLIILVTIAMCGSVVGDNFPGNLGHTMLDTAVDWAKSTIDTARKLAGVAWNSTKHMMNGDANDTAIHGRHGGSGGSELRFQCPYYGAVTAIDYRSGQYVDQLSFICTSWMGRTTFGPYGNGGGSPGTVSCPDQYYISSIYGRSNTRIDRLGIRCRHHTDMTSHGLDSGEFGGLGGSVFNDVSLSVNARPFIISVKTGDALDALSITYRNIPLSPLCTDCRGYREEWAPKRGGGGGGIHAFVCPDEGVIVGIRYRSGDRLDLIQFTCLSSYGESITPAFGGGGGDNILQDRCDPGFYIASIHGRSGILVDLLGIRCVQLGQFGSTPNRHGHGGSGGSVFDDAMYSLTGQRPVEIRVWSGHGVDAIQIKYGNMPTYNWSKVIGPAKMIKLLT